MTKVKIIGGGLAGCEAALYLARRGVPVELFEAKPLWKSAAHSTDTLAEIVCSNSLKSTLSTTASGALKNELNVLGCALLDIAKNVFVPAGSALAVDRDGFTKAVTQAVSECKSISVRHELVTELSNSDLTAVCAGPLCHEALAKKIMDITGEQALGFFDAAAPIITGESVDMSNAFFAARYGKGEGDYLNCPMTKEQYLAFYNELIHAERVIDEVGGVFEGCMPVEVMASRGVDALRFGPLRPVGFNEYGKPYAVLQLRRENTASTLYNLVGFQTNLKFGEQKRVFSLIPALSHAEFVRYGVMHRNTFVNAPKALNADLSLKNMDSVYIAGQLCGVEGYVESIATGLLVAINIERRLKGLPPTVPPDTTIIGALVKYLISPNADFQPMNANFGILPEIGGKKSERKQAYYDRSDSAIRQWVATLAQ